MKSVIHFGCNFSPAAYSGTLPAAPVILCAHEFAATADGQLEHRMDGKLCATVPPAGFDDYLHAWPQCAPVLAELRAAERGAAATVQPGKMSGAKKKAAKGARRR